jgi:transposase
MITAEMRAEMRRLVLVERWKVETVARRFSVHHSVVRRAVRDGVEPKPRVAPPSVLEPFKPYVVERLLAYPALTSARLFAELRQRGYTGSIAMLRRYVAKVRVPHSKKVYLRVEVEPGEQAQVDWGSFGHLRVGTSQRPLSAFLMVLSWSRALFVDFALDQKMDTFCRLHRRALEHFGGVPRRILYDNLKSVVLHHVGQTVQFNPTFLGFAGHYLFEPVAAPVRYPEAKGRVESSVKYLRHSFFYGRSFASIGDLRRQCALWLAETANARLHATTRERPADRLLLEKPRLRPLPKRPFDTDLVLPVIVSKEARVRLDANSYSVPPDLVGKTVHLRADDKTVRVVADGVEVASHTRCWDRRRAIEDPAHIQKLVERRKAAQGPKHKDRIASLAPECRLYLQEIARHKVDLRTEVRRLQRLVDIYGETEVASGMARALAQRTFGARYVRVLIDQSRFARGLGEPPEPIITGNPTADDIVVEPHDLETYDALFQGRHDQDTHSENSGESCESDDPDEDAGSGAAGDVDTDPGA